jgi:hypothetical protein
VIDAVGVQMMARYMQVDRFPGEESVLDDGEAVNLPALGQARYSAYPFCAFAA